MAVETVVSADETAPYDIVPTALAVSAMRDNGYKNAAYAVAELMDNAIQAEATVVELLCADEESMVGERSRRRLDQVAVLDNGVGMDAAALQVALQFGNGSRLEEGKRHGMGRFGMGLPSASISQCRRVEVWSWQNGSPPLYSYIDLDEIERERLREVPAPEQRDVPGLWREVAGSGSFGESGTLVVWSRIDRCLWRTSRALIDNSEEIIGRMYRDWLNDESVEIRLASFVGIAPEEMTHDRAALPNDPLYLMERTSCPKPFSDEPMFVPFPSAEACETKPTIRFRGEEHEVTIRFSIAAEGARLGDNAGNRPHGRHAKRNAGVSVVRAGRELELDPGWTNTYDPRERWWGVEVRFEPGLDELFGVANNKQSARNFAEAAKLDARELAKHHGGSVTAARAELEADGDPLAPLLEVVTRIQTNIDQMRTQIKSQAEGRRRRKRHEDESIERRATDAVRRRQHEGHTGESDRQETGSEEERKAALAAQLAAQGHDEREAASLAGETIDKGLKYRVETASLEGGAFFSVQSRGGVLLVTLNTDHPAYGLLAGAGDPSVLPDDLDQLKARLLASQEGLEMMLFAWARYEDEQVDERRRQTQNIRFDWGRMAEEFLDARGASS